MTDKRTESRKRLRALLVGFLRSHLVRWLARKLAVGLGFTLTGLQGWLVKLVVEYGFSKVFLPAINYAIDMGYLYADRKRGEIVVKKIKGADNVNEYRRRLDDLE